MNLLKTASTALFTVALATGLPAFADGHGDHSKDDAHSHGEHSMDIVDTAVKAGDFTTLVTAVQAAGLVDTLKGDGPFTVFAPNDAAFAKIPAATLEGLVADKEALTSVLGLHVIAGKVMAVDVVNMMTAETITGGKLMLEVKTAGVYVNGAKVIATDIETSNGVIHVIDTVITK